MLDRAVLGLLAAAALGWLLAYWLGQRRRAEALRRLAEGLGKVVAGLRDAPGEAALEQGRALAAGSLLGPLWDEVEALAGGYRQSLANLVEARSRNDDDAAPMERRFLGPAHVVVGSSRHRMVVRLAPNLNVIAATQPLCAFLGRTVSGLLGQPLPSAIHPGDRAALKQALAEALRDGEAHNVVVRTFSEGKGEKHVQLDVMTCFSESGKPLHLRCHFIDISAKVRTQRELLRITREVSQANDRLREANQDLERLKESYRDLYHFAPVLYFSLDPEGRLAVFNETTLRALGYPREELLGMPYADLLAPGLRDGFALDVMQSPGQTETRWVKKDGTIIDVWVGTTTIRDTGGGFIRSRSAALDVTETRRLSATVRAKADELALAVTELRRINQELEEFTYVVSHDLKEPLRTLEAFSTFLAQDYGDKLQGEGQEYISHLVLASRRLGLLIDDLLMLSRTGQVIRSPRPFAWGPVVATVLGDLHGLIQEKQASAAVEGALPACLGDPERVIQLLANLVGNGLKYNRGPSPEVRIGARPAAAGDRFATLWVRDNGQGIDPRHHEQIFRIFRRLHRQDEVAGTGAGLAICKRIVEAHGGRLWVESSPGQGAVFLFTLPLAPTEDSHGRPAAAGRG